MTTVQITLPDEFARQAAQVGLLAPARIESLLRDEFQRELARRKGFKQLDEWFAKVDADPLPPMTAEEIQAEIDAYRAEKRLKRASGS